MSKEYKNVVIAGAWENKNGNISTMPLDAKAMDTARNTMEHGGKILIRKRTEESIARSKDPAKAPTHYVEFVPKEVVDEYVANNPRQGNRFSL